MTAISPFAPASFPDLPPVDGMRIAIGQAGIKYRDRNDVVLAVFDEGTTVGGTFTLSKCPSAAVDWCRSALGGGRARALLVNSGNANAFTGQKGKETTTRSAAAVSRTVGCETGEIFLASTGVIGEPLDAGKIEGVVDGLHSRCAPGGWAQAARAIMTTDTYPKGSSRTVRIGGESVLINGIAKGAGMIAPNMATMLAFIVTDAPLSASVARSLIGKSVDRSFNAITVDGDTSTSDTVLLFATGRAKNVAPITDLGDPRLRCFKRALDEVTLDLAHQIVRDGEGARKFVSVTVRGAVSRRSARKVAFSLANSMILKAAIAGDDANWGRVVMAVGKAGEPADRDRLAIWFGDIRVAVGGERDPAYSEDLTSAYMKNDRIAITVDLGLGRGTDTVWTCDLTKEYVAINGDYRS